MQGQKKRQDSSRPWQDYYNTKTQGGVLVNKDITIDQDALILELGIRSLEWLSI